MNARSVVSKILLKKERLTLPAETVTPESVVRDAQRIYKDAIKRELSSHEATVFKRALAYFQKNPKDLPATGIELFEIVTHHIDDDRLGEMFAESMPREPQSFNEEFRHLIDTGGSPFNAGRFIELTHGDYHGEDRNRAAQEDRKTQWHEHTPEARSLERGVGTRVHTRLTLLKTPKE